jgi:Ca2+-binding RTX toxin-like protein
MASINGTDGNDVLAGTGDSDAIFGKGGDDKITAGAGRDTISGGAGNDDINGGDNFDYAAYSGRVVDYDISFKNKVLKIQDLRKAGDGIDKIADVEYLRFSNEVLDAKTLTAIGEITTTAAGGNDVVLTDASALDESLGTEEVDSVSYSGNATIVLPENIENATLTGAADSSVTGNDLANLLTGNAGNNTLFAGAGDDIVDGEGGDDTLVAGSGAGDDTYIGGEGIDTVTYHSTTLGVAVDLAAGTATGPEVGTDTLSGIENVDGGTGDDTLAGDNSSNVLNGLAGNDYLSGVDPATVGADLLDGGDGNDFLDALGDTARGGAGDDTIRSVDVRFGVNVIDGGDGVDTLLYDTQGTGVSVDLASGSSINGDTIHVENLTGSGFDDTLIGDAGVNVLRGGNGDDLLIGGGGGDVIDGGAGTDTASYVDSSDEVIVDLAGINPVSGGHALGDTLIGVENLEGSAFSDSLLGDDGANMLAGGGFGDALIGRGGDDLLRGDQDQDLLDGGTGADHLEGGYRTISWPAGRATTR